MKRISILIAALLALAVFAPLAFAAGGAESAASKGPVTIKILFSHAGATYTSKVTDWTANEYAKELSKMSGYNLVYEFGPHSGYEQFLTVRFASGDLPDIIRSPDVDSATAHPGAVDQGVFTEMGPLVDKYGPAIKKNIPEGLWKSPRIAKNGKIYGIPALVPYTASQIVYIRKDWLDQAGMQIPKTVDDFLKFYEWVKVNKKDAYGYFVRENMGYGELFFQAIGGVNSNTWSYRDGKFVPDMITPEMKEVVKFWKTLYDKGYINPNLFTMKATDWGPNIYQGKGASWNHDVANYDMSWTSLMLDKTAKLEMIPGPVGPKGGKLATGGDRYYFAMVFPTKSKVVADSVKFINWAWDSEPAQLFFTWGLKGVNYTEENGKIKYDPANPRNATDIEYLVYRLSLNPTNYASNTPRILATLADPDKFLNGYKAANEIAYKNPAMYLPAVSTFKTSPELNPGFGAGTLFLEMFAKAITGKEDLETSFNAFVAEWKKRGGDEAIKIATDWYKKANNIQ